ncbi:MAG: Gfo/Idh/MocA family oxidoreductase [Pirellulales bacterium]|nr:Gfo/Idh/MocA family oxidoreductase [Pirellulales bacterium]
MRRRDFITTTAVATSGLIVPWVHVASRDRGVEERAQVHVALIGIGYQGRILLNAARQIPELRFRALCDIWDYARNFGQKYLARYGQEVNTYTDFREMLDRETSLDAVLIATPDFAHAPQAIHCLEKGLHVYLEPMIAHTLSDIQSVIRAVSGSGKLLQVGYQRRSNLRYRHVLERLLNEAHLAGTLAAVQTQWAQEAADLRGWPQRYTMTEEQLRPFGYDNMNQFRNWMWYPQYCGGPFCAFVSQQLDICNWFLGTHPQSVMASGGNEHDRDRPHMDTVMSIFEYPAGPGLLRASCNMFTTTSAGGIRQYERFSGTQASLQISENPRWTQIGREANADDWEPWIRKQYLIQPEIQAADEAEDDAIDVQVSGELEMYQLPPLQQNARCAPHLANFLAAIRGEEDLRCPVDAAYPSQVAAFKAIDAAQQKRTIAIEPAADLTPGCGSDSRPSPSHSSWATTERTEDTEDKTK